MSPWFLHSSQQSFTAHSNTITKLWLKFNWLLLVLFEENRDTLCHKCVKDLKEEDRQYLADLGQPYQEY